MVFSSQIFLFFFLPITLIGYFICRKTQSKNLWLLFVSILFYAYGARKVVLILMFSVFVNWALALLVVKVENKKYRIAILVADIFANISYLFYFKYFNFVYDNISLFFDFPEQVDKIALPIGISFFTFQALSYFIDVYRNDKLVQKSIVNVALYVTFFPQLVAGPIVRYTTIADEIKNRKVTPENFNEGVIRFVYGLGKKVIIANILGTMVDEIYAMDPYGMSVGTAWLASVGYTLQIYFDFSGYSDMAIGLGRMFGFHFLENFNYPYISKSVTEFWRRWHISLSSWFRDYLYIPLGGNRLGIKRQIFNLSVVWICTGVWHGANWTFILWGILYGFFVIMEKLLKFEKRNLPPVIGHIYTLFIVNGLWVLFRANDIGMAGKILSTMLGIGKPALWDSTATFYLLENFTTLILAIIVSVPLAKSLSARKEYKKVIELGRPVFVLVVLLLSISFIVKGSYNPFIYFNF